MPAWCRTATEQSAELASTLASRSQVLQHSLTSAGATAALHRIDWVWIVLTGPCKCEQVAKAHCQTRRCVRLTQRSVDAWRSFVLRCSRPNTSTAMQRSRHVLS